MGNYIKDMLSGSTVEILESEQYKYDIMAYYELNLYAKTDVPEIKRELDFIYEANQKNIDLFKTEISRITQTFEEQNIDYCIMMGIPFSFEFHPNPNLRLQEDIDFFLDIKDLDKANTILESMGYYIWDSKDSKKHVTYLKNGQKGSDISLEGRCTVKLYKRMTDLPFGDIQFSDVKRYIVVKNGYRVLSTESLLFHYIVHSHHYALHPKILCDVYMICKSKKYDFDVVSSLLEKYNYQRTANIIFTIMNAIDGSELMPVNYSPDVNLICDMIMSPYYWERMYNTFDSYQITMLRCFVYDGVNYKNYYKQICDLQLERRVTPIKLFRHFLEGDE